MFIVFDRMIVRRVIRILDNEKTYQFGKCLGKIIGPSVKLGHIVYVIK